jgi:hypothetical protein
MSENIYPHGMTKEEYEQFLLHQINQEFKIDSVLAKLEAHKNNPTKKVQKKLVTLTNTKPIGNKEKVSEEFQQFLNEYGNNSSGGRKTKYRHRGRRRTRRRKSLRR